MANIIVVAALTVFRAEGKADLGKKDLLTFTIGDVKDEVSQIYDELEVERLQIWWKGYLLDNDTQKIVDACVGTSHLSIQFVSYNADDLMNMYHWSVVSYTNNIDCCFHCHIFMHRGKWRNTGEFGRNFGFVPNSQIK